MRSRMIGRDERDASFARAVTIRRALIGEAVKTPDGAIGKVTGINDQGIARVALAGARFVDVPQDRLLHVRIEVVR